MKLLSLILALMLIVFPVAAEAPHDSIDLQNDLFLVPIIYDHEDSGLLDAPDTQLHFFESAGVKFSNGAYLWGNETMPADYIPADQAGESPMHIWMLRNPAGLEYIPLFVSLDSLFYFFGPNIHVGVIDYDTAVALAIESSLMEAEAPAGASVCSGIVIAPGILNHIIPIETLVAN